MSSVQDRRDDTCDSAAWGTASLRRRALRRRKEAHLRSDDLVAGQAVEGHRVHRRRDVEAVYVFRKSQAEPVWTVGSLRERQTPRVAWSRLYVCSSAQAYPVFPMEHSVAWRRSPSASSKPGAHERARLIWLDPFAGPSVGRRGQAANCAKRMAMTAVADDGDRAGHSARKGARGRGSGSRPPGRAGHLCSFDRAVERCAGYRHARPQQLVLANAHTLNLVSEPEYRALQRAGLVLRDGLGVEMAARWYSLEAQHNFVGTDFVPRAA
jgi:hypothetical protein